MINYVEIAEKIRPEIDRDNIKSEWYEQLIDLLRCALIQKAKEEKEILEFLAKLPKD